jgi:hypothetical protein
MTTMAARMILMTIFMAMIAITRDLIIATGVHLDITTMAGLILNTKTTKSNTISTILNNYKDYNSKTIGSILNIRITSLTLLAQF